MRLCKIINLFSISHMFSCLPNFYDSHSEAFILEEIKMKRSDRLNRNQLKLGWVWKGMCPFYCPQSFFFFYPLHSFWCYLSSQYTLFLLKTPPIVVTYIFSLTLLCMRSKKTISSFAYLALLLITTNTVPLPIFVQLRCLHCMQMALSLSVLSKIKCLTFYFLLLLPTMVTQF